MRTRRGGWFHGSVPGLVGLAVVALVVSLAAAARDDEVPRRHGIFVDTIDVSLVNLVVHVTRDGAPVNDLTREDFELLDDGEPVEVTHFRRIEGGRRVPLVSGAEAIEPPAGDVVVQLPEPEPAVVVVVVDHPFLSAPSREVIFGQLTERLEQMMADGGTEVMVVSKDTTIEVVQPLTSGRAEVRSALDRQRLVATRDYAAAMRHEIASMDQAPQLRESMASGPGQTASLEFSTSEIDARAAMQTARAASQRMQGDVLASLSLLRGFIGALAGVPGRKAVLYVADRLPLRPGELVWQVWYQKYGLEWGARLGATSVDAALAEYDVSGGLGELIADAAANQVAFYPIGLGAAAGPDLSGAESRGLKTANRGAVRDRAAGSGLSWLASSTGGQVALGRSDDSNFYDQLEQDLSYYYSLAYASPHRGDGENHQVEVRVARPGVTVRFLDQYRDKSVSQQLVERTLATLILDTGENPLAVRVELGEPKKIKRGLYRVPLDVHIPIANLVLLPEATVHRGALSLQLMVRDETGRVSPAVNVPLPIEIPNRAMLDALSKTALYQTELELRPGRQTVAIGVHDDLASIASTVKVDLDVGRPD